MKIKNANGEVTLTPSSQAKEEAKEELKALKAKGKPKSIAELTERIEQIEKMLGV